MSWLPGSSLLEQKPEFYVTLFTFIPNPLNYSTKVHKLPTRSVKRLTKSSFVELHAFLPLSSSSVLPLSVFRRQKPGPDRYYILIKKSTAITKDRGTFQKTPFLFVATTAFCPKTSPFGLVQGSAAWLVDFFFFRDEVQSSAEIR